MNNNETQTDKGVKIQTLGGGRLSAGLTENSEGGVALLDGAEVAGTE